jgi:uncharacterized membrane protein YuzA (DUF378 family)
MSGYSNVLELPFLFIAVVFAFRTAQALKGGAFGKGMLLIALGALVMAIGHINMQMVSYWNFNLFTAIFGDSVGDVVWVIVLIATWLLTGLGFYFIYRAAKGN